MEKSDKTNDIQISGRFEWIFNEKEIEIFITKEGELLFNANSVGKALELANIRKTIADYDKNQVVSLKNLDVTNSYIRKFTMSGLGVPRALNNRGEKFLTEAGLYKVIFTSRKKEAEELQDWVCGKVLPSLRKNNYYIDKENINTPQLDNLQKELDTLRKENDVYNKDSNFYSIRDIRELLGGSIEIDTNKLKEMSCKLGLSIKQEKGYFNSKLTYYNRYHFLVWAKTYEDIFEITSDEKLKVKNAYDELNKG